MGNNTCNCLNMSKIKSNLNFGKDSEILFENIESNGSNLNQIGHYSNRSNTNFTKKNTENSSPINSGSSINYQNVNFKSKSDQRYYENFYNENDKIKKLIKIQSYIRKFLFKKKWDKSLKNNLILLNQEIIKKEILEFNVIDYQRYETYNPNFSKSLIPPPNLSKKRFKCKLLNYLFNEYPSIYIGEVDINYNRTGYGILYSLNNEKYEGYWDKNEIIGKGRLTNKNEESTYEGEFSHNIINGKGEKYYENCIYKGDFVNNKKEGKGEESTIDYDYKGEFSNDLKNGKGKVIYKNTGESYEGEFKDDELTGYGCYKWSNNHIYKGEFLNGNMNGNGYYTWPEGGYYKGNYINNIKEGKGEFMWPDGRIFKGFFKNGKPNGKGILIINNIEKEVEFNNGVIENENFLN